MTERTIVADEVTCPKCNYKSPFAYAFITPKLWDCPNCDTRCKVKPITKFESTEVHGE